MTAGICFLVCYVTKDNAFVTYEQSKVVIFAYTMACVWIGLFDSLPIFNEQKLYVEADFDNKDYSPLEYQISIIIIETILGLMQALIASSMFFTILEKPAIYKILLPRQAGLTLLSRAF